MDNNLYSQFIKTALKRKFTEDDAQEAIRLVIQRYGNSKLDGEAPLVMTYLTRALAEARKNNIPDGHRAGKLQVDDRIDIDYEINQPACKPNNKLENLLDKYIKRANLSNNQMQVLQAHLMDRDNRWIAKVFDMHINSVGNKLNAIRDKLNAVHLQCY